MADAGKLGQLQWRGTLFLGRMQGLDTPQGSLHERGLGRVGKALLLVPLGQGGQALLQGVERERAGKGRQVPRHLHRAGR